LAGSVQAKIDVIVGGLREVAALEGRLESLQSIITAINKDPIDLNKGGRGKGRDLSGKLSKNVNDLVRNFDNFGKSFASVNKQAGLFGDLMSQTALKSTGDFKKQDVAVKNLATAYTTATSEAARFDKQQINLIRTSKGLQTSVQREIELIKRRDRVSALRDKKRRGENMRQDLSLGVGFPLLFGGGPGSVAGGALGAIAGGGEGGFGLQILFSAVGGQIDQAVERAQEFGRAIQSIDVDRLNSALGNVSSELAIQVELLKEQGKLTQAQALIQAEVAKKTGLAGGAAENVANAVGILDSGFKEAVNAASGLLGIIGAPFAAAIGLILSLVGKTVALLNTLLSGVGKVLERFGRWAIEITLGKAAAEKLDQAIKNMNTSLNESVVKSAQLKRNLLDAAVEAGIDLSVAQRKLPDTSLENKLANERLVLGRKILGIEAERDKQIKQMLVDTTQSTTEERAKAGQTIINTAEYKKQTASLESNLRITKLTTEALRKQTNAEIAADLAQRVFELQPLPDPTPFSKATPEEDKNFALDLQAAKFAANRERINNKNLSNLQKEAELKRAGAQNDLNILNINKQYVETIKQRNEMHLTQVENLQHELDLTQATTQAERDRLKIEKELKKLDRQGFLDGEQAQIGNLMEQLAVAQQPLNAFIRKATEDLNNLQQVAVDVSQGIGNAIGGSLVNGLQGLVTGATSVKQVFADILKSVADVLAKTAAQMIAQYIAIGIAKAFAGMGGGGGENNLNVGLVQSYMAEGDYVSGGFKAFDQGGVVSKPTLGLVGEGGEPEYIIPQSKMRESMSRYSRGSRGGGVIPDNRGGSASEDGGTAVAAPIDVRYTVERINSVDYVTADQFQNGMQSAAAQGAQRGEQNTLKRLQMSGSTRKRIGL
jgi:hypothetical protein